MATSGSVPIPPLHRIVRKLTDDEASICVACGAYGVSVVGWMDLIGEKDLRRFLAKHDSGYVMPTAKDAKHFWLVEPLEEVV